VNTCFTMPFVAALLFLSPGSMFNTNNLSTEELKCHDSPCYHSFLSTSEYLFVGGVHIAFIVSFMCH
jgi:Sec-independent protein secretion pathway component TatC